jgi:hypothetical protein
MMKRVNGELVDIPKMESAPNCAAWRCHGGSIGVPNNHHAIYMLAKHCIYYTRLSPSWGTLWLTKLSGDGRLSSALSGYDLRYVGALLNLLKSMLMTFISAMYFIFTLSFS